MSMTDSDLRALLDASKSDALSATAAAKLTSERADAQDYYLGNMDKDMPAQVGRSKAVSTDVADTIEGLMPSLMEIFCGSDEVVKFEPVGAEDVKGAEQETDYVNHVFMQKNPGFLVLYSFIKDALLSKVGIVKVWWEDREEETRETYLDQSEQAFAMIAADPEVEIVEHTEHAPDMESGSSTPQGAIEGTANATPLGPNPGLGGQSGMYGQAGGPPQTLHDITVVEKKTYSCAKALGVPPEEFGIERNARSIRDSNYCFHEVKKSQAALIADGFDAEQVKKLPSYGNVDGIEQLARSSVDENIISGEQQNEAARLIRVTEHYVRMDYAKDGKAKLYRVTTGGEGGEILKRDGEKDIVPYDAMPFAAMTPVIITHRFFGRSIADLVMDIQRIKTALLRGGLDHVYMANNPRPTVSESQSGPNTLDDLLVSRHGAVIRVKGDPNSAIAWQQIPPIGAHLFPMIEYMDAQREWRTGVSRAGQGLDANALQNQSATAANQLFTAAQARMKLIARIFAETGIRDLFSLLHATIRKHGQQAETVRLRNEWVQVDPRQWKRRDDMTINVGLGTGGKAEQLSHLQLIIVAQEKAIAAGLVSKKNLWESAKQLVRLAGYKDPDSYFTPPGKAPDPQDPSSAPIQPPPDPKMAELQMKAQLDQKAQENSAQIETLQAQADIATQDRKTQAEMALAEKKFALESQLALINAQIKQDEHQQTMQMKTQQHDQSMQMAEKKSQDHGAKASIEVKHGADEITGPMAQVIAQLGEHLSNNQAQHTQALVNAMAEHSKPKRIKGPSGKVYQIESVN